MNDVTFNKKEIIKYLTWTFLITWIMQVAAAVLYWKGLAAFGQLLISIIMFVPLFGVLLSGHTLSGMGWKETLHHIKELPEQENLCRETPVIILTGNVLAGDREKYLEMGFDEYLSKPIVPEKLEKMIRDFLPKELLIQGTEQS